MARLIAKNIMKNIHVLPTEKPSRLAIQLDCKPKYNLQLSKIENDWTKNWEKQNIYITNDEQIKVGDFFITKNNTLFKRWSEDTELGLCLLGAKKIILTTDQDLIKYGVQAIDDEFLEWFVKNPSCEFVEVEKIYLSNKGEWKEVLLPSEWEQNTKTKFKIMTIFGTPQEMYDENEDFKKSCEKIIIPKEEPKQETLEEVAEKHIPNRIRSTPFGGKFEWEPRKERNAFIKGIKSDVARDYWFKQFQEQDRNKYSEEDMESYSNYCWRLSNDNRYKSPLSPKEWFEQFKKK